MKQRFREGVCIDRSPLRKELGEQSEWRDSDPWSCNMGGMTMNAPSSARADLETSSINLANAAAFEDSGLHSEGVGLATINKYNNSEHT